MHSLTGGFRGDGPPVGCKLVFFHDFFQFATVQGGGGVGVGEGSLRGRDCCIYMRI